MSWLSRLVHGGRSVPTALAERVQRWQDVPAVDLARQHFESRYVVINTEATGLDLDRDRLLAIAAIAIDGGLLYPAKALYLPAGDALQQSLVELLEFAGRSPWVVFNAAFNRRLIERSFTECLALEPDPPWIDLQWLLPALFPEFPAGPSRLADWMERTGIETFQRHHALGDGYAVAQLLMAALGRGHAAGAVSPRGLMELERGQRRLQGIT